MGNVTCVHAAAFSRIGNFRCSFVAALKLTQTDREEENEIYLGRLKTNL